MKPRCCNRNAKQTFKRYCVQGVVISVATFFTCIVCGHVGVPYMDKFDQSHMNAMEAVRLAGIEFDNTLTKVHN